MNHWVKEETTMSEKEQSERDKETEAMADVAYERAIQRVRESSEETRTTETYLSDDEINTAATAIRDAVDQAERDELKRRLKELDEKLAGSERSDTELLDTEAAQHLTDLILEPGFEDKDLATEAQISYLSSDIIGTKQQVMTMLSRANTEYALKRLAVIYVQLMETDR